MFQWLSRLFLPEEHPDITQSLIVILIAIAAGVFVGRIKVKGVSLGVSAVMFTGLLMGHVGYRINENILDFIRDLGLILFVYGIGIQVGPSFFSSFRKEGVKLNALAVSTVLLSAVITYLIFRFTGQQIDNMVGLMSGAVTNTPGLGAAKAALNEIQHSFPGKKFNDPAIAYAIAYPAGVLCVILSIIAAKGLLRINTEKEALRFIEEKSKSESPVIHKKCRVLTPEFFDKSIYEVLTATHSDHLIISRLKHSGSQTVFSPSLDTTIRERDVLMVVGAMEDVDHFIRQVGRESTDQFIESEHDVVTRNIFVTNRSAIHKNLAELDLFNRYNLKVTRVFRSGMELLASPSLELFYGDKLRLVGNQKAVDEAVKIIGNSEKRLLEPDFLSLFGGLLIGIIIGSIPLMIPSLPVPLKLGFAAGPLLAALLISRYGGIGVIHSYLNNGAIYFMKDLGICLFFAAVGVHAGEDFYSNFVQYNGWMWIFYACLIAIIPLAFMVVVGKFIMKTNFLQLAGLMSGAYTDPAALAFSNSYFDSDIPSQSYATVYPLVTICRIFMAQLLILLFV
jgi:putative transport protein